MKRANFVFALFVFAVSGNVYSQTTWNNSTVETTVGTSNAAGVTTPTTKVIIQEDNPVLEIKDNTPFYMGGASGNNGGSAGIKLTIPHNNTSYNINAEFNGAIGPHFKIQGPGPLIGLTNTSIHIGGIGVTTTYTTYLTGPAVFNSTANFVQSTNFNNTSNTFKGLTVGNTASINSVVFTSVGKALIGGDISSFPFGTPTGYSLYVKNGILTEKLRIALATDEDHWADFVFDKNYKLRSLNEVETFIKQNHHLPEIPSAEEVKSNGVDMLQMDAKLLQKVEELTLYMIEMNKAVENLKKENEALKKEISELK